MRMTIALPYTMQDADRLGMLRPAEQDSYNAQLAEALSDLPLGHPKAVLAARAVQRAVIEPKAEALRSRVTAALLERAVRVKFKDGLTRKDRRRWEVLLDQLEEDPAELEVSAEDAAWLVELCTEKTLDSFPPEHARWINLLEDEIERLRQVLKDPAALQPAAE